MFLVSFLIALVFSFLVSACLKIRHPLVYLLSVFLLFCSHLVLAFQAAGLVSILNKPIPFLAIQFCLSLLALIVWLLRRRPVFFADVVKVHLSWRSLSQFLRQNPVLAIFGLLVAIAYGINAYLIYQVPPNNNDSLYVHMARVGHWILNGSLTDYPTYYLFQHYYPYNAQGLILWTTLFSGSDHFAGYVQFFAAIVGACIVYGFARLLERSTNQSMFAALLWLAVPQVFFESTTTQVDLIVTAFVLASFYLLFFGFKYGERNALILAGISLGLAIGTKQTAFFALPALGLILFVYLLSSRSYFHLVKTVFLSILVSTLMLGSIAYIRNYQWYGNFQGPRESVDFLRIDGSTSMVRAFALNTSRLGYQFLDTTALPPILEGYIFRGKARLAKAGFAAIGMPLDTSEAWYPDRVLQFDYLTRPTLQEDSCWFGLIYAIGLPILLLFALIRSIRERNLLLVILPVTFITFHIAEFLVRPGWDFYLGRNYLIPVSVAAPLFGFVYQPKLRSRLLTGIVLVLASYMLVNMTLNNESKPLQGRDAIWILDREQKITLQSRFLRMPLDFVERKVPDGSTLGLSADILEYPFFGEGFTRQVSAIKPVEKLADRDWLIKNQIDFLLVRNRAVPPDIKIPFTPMLSDSEWALYKIQ